MRQVLIEIPMLWIAVGVLALGAGMLLWGLLRRGQDMVYTGAIVCAVVLVGGWLVRDRLFTGSLPIFGFGMMLCLAFFAATWLGRRMARREKLDEDRVMDLALWMFVGGIVGARLLFIARNPDQFHGPLDFFKFWQGGIVFYGGVIASTAVFIYYTRRHALPALRVLDVTAPAVALGIGIGRFGCLLNGCCWGEPTELPWGIRFPYGSIPHVEQLFEYPDRTSLGFRISDREGHEPIVLAVEPGSWADTAGLLQGDLVRRVNGEEVVRTDRGHEMRDARALIGLLAAVPPHSELELAVERQEKSVAVTGPFTPVPPHSLSVHPTQVYMALAGWGLLGLTLAYYPRRRRSGEVMAVAMIGYAVTRFSIEYFRGDERPWALGLTVSQVISVVIFVGGIGLLAWLWHGSATVAPSHQPRSESTAAT